MTVLDASAIEAALLDGATCGAANWSEVAQTVLAAGREWRTSAALLASYELMVEPVTKDDAELAAAAWHPGSELSLADRLCQALARRLGVTALTADRVWGSSDGVHQIR